MDDGLHHAGLRSGPYGKYCFVLKGWTNHKIHLTNDAGRPRCNANVDVSALENDDDPPLNASDACLRCFPEMKA